MEVWRPPGLKGDMGSTGKALPGDSEQVLQRILNELRVGGERGRSCFLNVLKIDVICQHPLFFQYSYL